ncbi:hypothetical protein VKT23_015661 [Stygiomarasmius scandens]|uniref:Uncharacterized protein n=1 Tax=Marasmiellus scandens TaxID=2682957 RepID=A0ABR1IX60_9AGAR
MIPTKFSGPITSVCIPTGVPGVYTSHVVEGKRKPPTPRSTIGNPYIGTSRIHSTRPGRSGTRRLGDVMANNATDLRPVTLLVPHIFQGYSPRTPLKSKSNSAGKGSKPCHVKSPLNNVAFMDDIEDVGDNHIFKENGRGVCLDVASWRNELQKELNHRSKELRTREQERVQRLRQRGVGARRVSVGNGLRQQYRREERVDTGSGVNKRFWNHPFIKATALPVKSAANSTKKRKADEMATSSSETSDIDGAPQPKKARTEAEDSPVLDEWTVLEWVLNNPKRNDQECIRHFKPLLKLASTEVRRKFAGWLMTNKKRHSVTAKE